MSAEPGDVVARINQILTDAATLRNVLEDACGAVADANKSLATARLERDQIVAEKRRLATEIEALQRRKIEAVRAAEEVEAKVNALQEQHSVLLGGIDMVKRDALNLAQRLSRAE